MSPAGKTRKAGPVRCWDTRPQAAVEYLGLFNAPGKFYFTVKKQEVMNASHEDRPSGASLKALFEKQRNYAPIAAAGTFRQRKAKLGRMLNYLMAHSDAVESATFNDFRKPAAEAQLAEIISLTTELRYHIRHLRRWMKPHRVPGTLLAAGTDAYIRFEPKGTTLIMAPWNYPVSLALKPLIAAISAGCVAIVKPSEYTPHASGFIKKMIANLFNPEEVAVVEGDREIAGLLLELPFDHIFFTGSPQTGKIVMAAAARNLTSVSLELGGKSPAIVDKSADIPAAARRIVWAKFFNNGQTCIAPDYILVHSEVQERLQREMVTAITEMYNPKGRGIEASEDYARIVNEKHFLRLKGYLDEALAKGATLVTGGTTREETLFIAPTLLTGVNGDMALMKEEIFGPLLPVLPFRSLEEAISQVNSLEKPLALYILTGEVRYADLILRRTSSGNALVNEMLLQFQHLEIPFGGVNHSGIGKSNGFFGFQEFSNPKGIIRRKYGTLRFLYPPYTSATRQILKWIRNYL